jgi:hypothetical protein
MSHNVSAVGDVFAARIRALRSKDHGWQTVGVVSRGNGAQRNDLGERNPEPLLRRSVNSPVIRRFFSPICQSPPAMDGGGRFSVFIIFISQNI